MKDDLVLTRLPYFLWTLGIRTLSYLFVPEIVAKSVTPEVPFALFVIVEIGILIYLTVARCRDLGKPSKFSLWILVPGAFLYFWLMPGESVRQSKEYWDKKAEKRRLKSELLTKAEWQKKVDSRANLKEAEKNREQLGQIASEVAKAHSARVSSSIDPELVKKHRIEKSLEGSFYYQGKSFRTLEEAIEYAEHQS